jgi:hypothetical protein
MHLHRSERRVRRCTKAEHTSVNTCTALAYLGPRHPPSSSFYGLAVAAIMLSLSLSIRRTTFMSRQHRTLLQDSTHAVR